MIILSCGHSVDNFDCSFDIITKETDRYGGKALAYRTVCESCKDQYQQSNQLFDTEEQANYWLFNENLK